MASLGTFLREVRSTFHTTGALFPSSPALARAMVQALRGMPSPRRVLEIGPGTGAVTDAILQVLDDQDSLDLVEINETFADHLRDRFRRDSQWAQATVPWTLHVGDLLDIDLDPGFDAIISGVPMNNFSPELVRSLIDRTLALGRPGGYYGFFEYYAIRSVKKCFVGPSERNRLQGVGDVMHEYLAKHETSRDVVYANIPPAVAHHLTL